MTSSLHVVESGSPSGPAVVLVHGAGLAGWVWQQVAEHLQGFHVLVPDLPAHGASPGPFALDNAADRVAQAIGERVAHGPIHVVGHSLGGQVALTLLARHPQLPATVVVSGSLTRPAAVAPLVPPLVKAYWPLRQNPGLIRLTMKSQGIPEEFFHRFSTAIAEMDREELIQVLTAALTFSPPPELGKVSTPVLVLAGEREPRLVHRSMADLVALLPAVAARRIPGGDHGWPLSQPQLFAQILEEWTQSPKTCAKR